MYTGALGRVNALEFRSPSKGEVPAVAAVMPASSDVFERAFSKVKEIALTSPDCSNYSEAELLACFSLPSPTSKGCRQSAASCGDTHETDHAESSSSSSVNTLLDSFSTLDLAAVAARSPLSEQPRLQLVLHDIPEALLEDDGSPRVDTPECTDDDDETNDVRVLSAKEAHRLLRGGGSFASRVKQRAPPSIAEIELAKQARVVEKINRQSIVRRTTLRRTSSRVSFALDMPPPPGAMMMTAPPPPRATVVLKKPPVIRTARASTVVSHTSKGPDQTLTLDATKRVSNMKLGTSPKKAKIKHEDLITTVHENNRSRRRPRRLGDELIKQQASHVSLDVVDRIGTRAACPVHLLLEQPVVDFSYVPGVVNSYNKPAKRKSVRVKRLKRPSLWVAMHCTA
ncbi:hypothetical protein SPRG_18831 [Saprolegnia parasitica CBS 223.65]|uniref:Uncharacterized protein n=1 Tax=Saprolegnia parasitica (strain CBS 223.65) TaxID=695850 RepID=A0A067DAQ5_SAPPC|nr:hypothetical protein SPRG_18831 [Saprolegnia parasitica CBS 223.65]KDO35671.1 hypothetical protein SPRG_18831 [Saprolegnia parasitica CBS 223.65]|eukprot:XP_012194047.1 hypothetical protein SPRG_18831 [Saprolegnia parasitica CBS 223.65]